MAELYILGTDTVLGIGTDARSTESIKRVNRIKLRDENTVLQVTFSSVEMLSNYVELSKLNLEVLNKFLPGPFTFILPSLANTPLSEIVTPHLKIGVRVPKNRSLCNFIDKLGYPLATTSANYHGKPPAIRLAEVPKEILNQCNILTETVEECDASGIASGVIDLTVTPIKVLRDHPDNAEVLQFISASSLR